MISRLLALTITAAVALGVAGSASAGRTGNSGWESAPFRSFSPYGTTHSGTWDTIHTYAVNGKKRTCTLTRGAKCVGAQLRGKVKHHGDLRKANLRRADLRFADLRGANLAGADLRSANLKYADLRGANLRGARLQHAPTARFTGKSSHALVPPCYPDCIGADLRGANLAGANLAGAHLGLANISTADFTGANLTNSKMFLTTMNGTDFRSADLTGSIVFALWRTTRPVMNPATTCPSGFSAALYGGNKCKFDRPVPGAPLPWGERPRVDAPGR